MNLKYMGEWVEALRSGKYTKCVGDYALFNELTGETEFCVIGVFIEVYYEKGHGYINPMMVDEIATLELLDILEIDESFLDSIINWNDNLDMSFDEIADHLEQIHETDKIDNTVSVK